MKKKYPIEAEKSVQPGMLHQMEGKMEENEINRMRGGIERYGIPSKCVIPEAISSSNQSREN